MSILTWIDDNERLKLLNASRYVRPSTDSNKGLWTRCDKCGVILYIKHLIENQRVCFGCAYHLQMNSPERIRNLLDKESWRPFDETVSPCDPLEFHDQKNYTDRLQAAQDKTGLQDAIQTGTGRIEGIPVALGVMDFDFMGGSMGSVVGEKITRLIEYATQEGLTLILICASGGARMQEGVFGLMQMAKISSALRIYQSCANLLYISILSSPTTGGVTASFGMLGDIIFAEPRALIAFAGRRVIEQTLCEDLPEDFQSSEYMLNHGLVDLIVPRRFLRQALSESIKFYKNAPFKRTGKIPFGVQNPIHFVTEEKIRRQWKNQVKWESLLPEHSYSSTYEPNTLNKEQVANKASNPKTKESYSNPVQKLESDDILNKSDNSITQGENLYKKSLEIDYPKTKFVPSSYQSESLVEQTFPGNFDTQNNSSFKRDQYAKNGQEIQEDAITVPVQLSDQIKKNLAKSSNSNMRTSDLSLLEYQDQNDLYSRNKSKYREILTSFQMIFNLFHKQLVLPEHSNEIDTDDFIEQKSLLQRFEHLLETNDNREVPASSNFNDSIDSRVTVTDPLHSNEDTFDSQRSKVQKDTLDSENLENSQRGLVIDPKKDIDFLNQAIELAATESIEWRAFYVSQRISKTTAEDFFVQVQNQTLQQVKSKQLPKQGFGNSYTESLPWNENQLQAEVGLTLNSSENIQSFLNKDNTMLHNTLFYKSICRSTSR